MLYSKQIFEQNDRYKMSQNTPKTIFVAGTDQGVGKTFISCILAQGLQASYWKPLQPQSKNITDTDFVKKATGLPETHFIPEVRKFKTALSPHASAFIENIYDNYSQIPLPQYDTDHLIIEGTGGVLVPLDQRNSTEADMIQSLGAPVVIVTKSNQSTINHTLMTIQILRSRNIPILGVVINGVPNQLYKDTIEEFGSVPVIAQIAFQRMMSEHSLENLFKSFNLSVNKEEMHQRGLEPLTT